MRKNATNQVICRLNGAISSTRALKNFLKSKATQTVKETTIEFHAQFKVSWEDHDFVFFLQSYRLITFIDCDF